MYTEAADSRDVDQRQTGEGLRGAMTSGMDEDRLRTSSLGLPLAGLVRELLQHGGQAQQQEVTCVGLGSAELIVGAVKSV